MDAFEIKLERLMNNNPTLTELQLLYVNIGVDGARAIAEALPHNTSLTKVDLHDVDIGTDGARAIAEALPNNTHLKKLTPRLPTYTIAHGITCGDSSKTVVLAGKAPGS